MYDTFFIFSIEFIPYNVIKKWVLIDPTVRYNCNRAMALCSIGAGERLISHKYILILMKTGLFMKTIDFHRF